MPLARSRRHLAFRLGRRPASSVQSVPDLPHGTNCTLDEGNALGPSCFTSPGQRVKDRAPGAAIGSPLTEESGVTLMETEALIPAIRDRMRSELRALQRSGTFDVLFGGGVDRHRLHLSDFSGTRSRVLRGLVIQAQRGAGGRALVERRPVRVDHYRTAPIIMTTTARSPPKGSKRSWPRPSSSRGGREGSCTAAYDVRSPSVTVPVGELKSAASALAYQFAVQDEVGFRLRAWPTSCAGIRGSGGTRASPRRSPRATSPYRRSRRWSTTPSYGPGSAGSSSRCAVWAVPPTSRWSG